MDSSWGPTLRGLLDALRVDAPAGRSAVRAARGSGSAAASTGLPADVIAAIWRALPCDVAWYLDLTATGRVAHHLRHPGGPGPGRAPAAAGLAEHVPACPLCQDPASFADPYGVASTGDASVARVVGAAAAYQGGAPRGSPHDVAGGEALVVELPGSSPRGARLVLCRRRCPFSPDERLALGLLLPHLAGACRRRADLAQLGGITHRQRQVLELVAQGCTNAEIGARLLVSTGTVRKHLDNIFAELHVSSRAAAAARAQVLVQPAVGPGEGA
ncbi:helix-turn-helix transcriptional regulator [Intrasporangium sp.]|uniref:helix-turn-helix transcriptional regulator n=1 Tax=Intrasporangium sp. TaxID=1925024 RepID=UPI0032216B6C